MCNPSPEDEYRPLLIQQKIASMKTPKLAKRSLTRSEMTAMTRLQQSQRERCELKGDSEENAGTDEVV